MNHTSPTTDTSHDAFAVQLELVRRMAPIDRLRKAFALSRQVKRMSMDAIQRRHPEFDEYAIRLKFIELAYGKPIADGVRRYQKERLVG